MALFGWTVFWGLIIFCIFVLGYAIGRDNGIQREQDRHNQVFFSSNEKFQYEQRMRNR